MCIQESTVYAQQAHNSGGFHKNKNCAFPLYKDKFK